MVLNFGQILAKGTPKEIAENHAVQAAYLGDAA
jgi:ABC-type branched-subunit amino acid transport system ATPase component